MNSPTYTEIPIAEIECDPELLPEIMEIVNKMIHISKSLAPVDTTALKQSITIAVKY